MKKPTREQLELELKEKIGLYQESEKMIQQLKTDLNELLFSKKASFYSEPRRAFGDIKIEIARLQERAEARNDRGVGDIAIRILREENAKLWYMVRLSMNDASIHEPINRETNQSAFNRPDFNV